MSNYANRFELINDQCTLLKSKILDIGSKIGKDLLIFNQQGFTQLIGIDIGIDYTASSYLFVQHLLDNKEIVCEGNNYYFINLPNKKYSELELFSFIKENKELQSRYKKLKSEITLLMLDFNNYPTEFDEIHQFNLVMCSFVLHFYPNARDIELINKLKSFLLPDGYLYIKVHNIKRFDSYKNEKTDEQLKNIEFDKTLMTIKDMNTNKEMKWYLFDSKRIETYIKSFKLIYLGSEEKDFIELILQN